MGCSCVTTTRMVLLLACTIFPRSTRRRPTRPLIVLYGAFELLDGLLLVVNLLLRNGVLAEGSAIAIEVDTRLRQSGFVAGHLPLNLGELRLIRARIDVDERIAGVHHLAFAVMDRDNLALHAAGDGHGVDRRYGAKAFDVDTNVALLHDTRGNRNRARPAPRRGLVGQLRGLVLVIHPVSGTENEDERDQPDPGMVTASGRRLWRQPGRFVK